MGKHNQAVTCCNRIRLNREDLCGILLWPDGVSSGARHPGAAPDSTLTAGISSLNGLASSKHKPIFRDMGSQLFKRNDVRKKLRGSSRITASRDCPETDGGL